MTQTTQPFHCVFLAAGYATRMYPLTRETPKPLLPIRGRPVIEYLLGKLVSLPSLEQVVVVTNHKFFPVFSEWAQPWVGALGVRVLDDGSTSNDNRLGAIGDLAFAVRETGLAGQDVLVLAADNHFDGALDAFIAFAQSRPAAAAAASMGVYELGDRAAAHRYGVVALGLDDRVTQFLEKPADPPSSLIATGLYYLPVPVVEMLPRYLAEYPKQDAPGHWMAWLTDQRRLFGYRLPGRWYDIGDLKTFQRVQGSESSV